MASTLNLHRTIAFVINALIIGLILYTVIKDGSDKSPIIFMVFYPALAILNLIIAIVLWLLKVKQAKIYRQIFIGQLLLFVPLVFLISQF
jgi:hypothetical protein